MQRRIILATCKLPPALTRIAVASPLRYAGRTFNDLAQYPVFPCVLADYTSAALDLANRETFRDLSAPMGGQTPKRREKFLERYEALCELGDPPFHYGSHYSNAGAVSALNMMILPQTLFTDDAARWGSVLFVGSSRRWALFLTGHLLIAVCLHGRYCISW